MKPKDEVQFHTITKKLREDEKIKRMKEYMQHGRVSTFEHVERVARTAFRIDRFFISGVRKTSYCEAHTFMTISCMTGIIMKDLSTVHIIRKLLLRTRLRILKTLRREKRTL